MESDKIDFLYKNIVDVVETWEDLDTLETLLHKKNRDLFSVSVMKTDRVYDFDTSDEFGNIVVDIGDILIQDDNNKYLSAGEKRTLNFRTPQGLLTFIDYISGSNKYTLILLKNLPDTFNVTPMDFKDRGVLTHFYKSKRGTICETQNKDFWDHRELGTLVRDKLLNYNNRGLHVIVMNKNIFLGTVLKLDGIKNNNNNNNNNNDDDDDDDDKVAVRIVNASLQKLQRHNNCNLLTVTIVMDKGLI